MNQRSICPGCEFILTRCLCDTLTPIDNSTTLIILQHPSERKHPLNTVRLMKKSFHKIKIFIGENFNDHPDFLELLEKHNDSLALVFLQQQSIPLETNTAKNISHVILIDGSWKKAKKIFYLTTKLHALPSFFLKINRSSLYRLRSSRIKESLSTLEASIEALKVIEPALSCESLEKTFTKMIDDQIKKMGTDIFEKNYSKNER